MTFYEMLVKDYNEIFPFKKNTYAFLKDQLKNDATVLDLAAGIGTYTSEFHKDGYDVTGVELSEAMVKNGLKQSKDLPLHVGDMRNFKKDFDASYDLIYCIGNSIVHLDSKQEIKTLFEDTFETLKSGGRLVVQIVNYDRIMQKQLNHLPTITYGSGKTFERLYDFKGSKIEFIGRLSNGKKVHESSVALIPLLRGELNAMLNGIGFKNVTFYSGFDRSKYTVEKTPLVLEAFKE